MSTWALRKNIAIYFRGEKYITLIMSNSAPLKDRQVFVLYVIFQVFFVEIECRGPYLPEYMGTDRQTNHSD